jgi:hypothetical protein
VTLTTMVIGKKSTLCEEEKMSMSDDVPITRLPPGEAFGARDLQRWSHRRAFGRAGVPVTREEKKVIAKQQREARRAGLRDDGAGSSDAAQWVRQHRDDAPMKNQKEEQQRRAERERIAKRNAPLLARIGEQEYLANAGRPRGKRR